MRQLCAKTSVFYKNSQNVYNSVKVTERVSNRYFASSRLGDIKHTGLDIV